MPEQYYQPSLFIGDDQANRSERPPAADETPMPDKPAVGNAPVLATLAAQAADCHGCRLRGGCQGVVFGEGNAAARLLFVGEGPGETEDRLGRPFVGKAGQLLDKILAAALIPREDIYITNVVKCRPPHNRLPQPEEVAACRLWLMRQIDCINPRLIVCLGALATQTLIDPAARITKVRGNVFQRDERQIIPTYHPAALLRDESKKRPVWEDFKKISALYTVAD